MILSILSENIYSQFTKEELEKIEKKIILFDYHTNLISEQNKIISGYRSLVALKNEEIKNNKKQSIKRSIIISGISFAGGFIFAYLIKK
jgi:ribonucleotide reductase beta subunit family protein with ferritin-like domain